MKLDWPRLKVRIALVDRQRCWPGWSIDAAWSSGLPDCDLWLIEGGRGWMQLEDRRIDLRAGVCLWLRPGRVYLAAQDEADPIRQTYIHFDLLTTRRRPMCRHDQLPPEIHEPINFHWLTATSQRVVELVGRERPFTDRPESRQLAESLLRAMLMELDHGSAQPTGQVSGTVRHHREVIHRLVSHIAENLQTIDDIAALAQEFGYSPDHLRRIFQQVVGVSPHEYLLRVRLGRARQLLRSSGLTVSQIADLLGYRSVSFFSRQFKTKVGCSPAAYRKRRPGG